MRLIARTDNNHQTIVKQLRKLGASVQSIATIGKGCPDLLVGYKLQNYLFEIKNPQQPPSKRKLTPDEKNWFNRWNGQVVAVQDIDEIMIVLGIEKGITCYD